MSVRIGAVAGADESVTKTHIAQVMRALNFGTAYMLGASPPNSRLYQIQKIAIGLTGPPVPPGTASGATTNMNSQRFNFAAMAARASGSKSSINGMPSQAIAV